MPEPDTGLPMHPPPPPSEDASASEPGAAKLKAVSTPSPKGRFNWRFIVRSIVWLALAMWILGGRVGQSVGLTMPWSLPARVGVLAGAVLLGQLVAFSMRKGLRYGGQIVMLALWPFWAPIKLAYYILRGLSGPVAAARRVLGLFRRFCMGLAGKISLMVAVVLAVWAIYRTTDRTLMWIEVALLAFFFALLLVGFFHLATRPFFLVERRLRFWYWVVSKMQSSARKDLAKVGQEEKARNGWTEPLLYSTAWVRMQRDTLDGAQRSLAPLTVFMVGLLLMVGVTTATYAGAYHALDHLAAIPEVAASHGFADDMVTSLMIVCGVAVPLELLHPPTAATVAVALEVLTGLFLLVVAILAFTMGSAQHAEELKSAFGQRYDSLSARCVEDLGMLAPTWEIEAELAVAQENIKAVMEIRVPKAKHAKLPEQNKAARKPL